MRKVLGRILAVTMVLQMLLSMVAFNFVVQAANQSRMLKVIGNQVVFEDEPSKLVRLTGLNVPGGEWTGTPDVERIKRSVTEAMTNWHSNLIRLPVSLNGWYGNYTYVSDGGTGYRRYMDEVIQMISDAGKYVVLDLHHYRCFDNPLYLQFWQEAAVKYKNNPTVLFGILNEPHSVTWEVWRNGNGSNITGHQQVVEMIRDLGAKNIIIAGGLDWSYDLKGIAGESGDGVVYALVDQGSGNDLSKAGNGIIYDTHIYPWKGRTANWDRAVGTVRKNYPVLVGENGWDPADILSIAKKTYYPGDDMYHDKWVPELFAWMNDKETYGNYAHWTGWCFHPISSPKILEDRDNFKSTSYAYPPTSYWGVYIKAQLQTDQATHYTNARVVRSVEVQDTKKRYFLGDPFEYSIGKVIVTYEDDTVKELTLNDAGVSVSGFDSSEVTDGVTITVTYTDVLGSYVNTYPVNIVPVVVSGPDNVDASMISNRYADIDFEDAAYYTDPDSGLINDTIITMTNKADNSTAYFKTYPNGTSTERYMIYNTPAETKFVSPRDRKKNIAFDFSLPTAAYRTDELIYVDFKVKRLSTSEDPSSICLVDDTNKKIFTIKFPGGMIPTLIADQTYGTETAVAGDTIVNYPPGIGWRYIRAIINFGRKSFELYQGDSFETLTSFVSNQNTFQFQNNQAVNLARLSNYDLTTDRKGSLGFDDMGIYSVVTTSNNPSVGNVKVNGKPNIGATLTGIYSLINASEAESVLKWETAMDASFTNPTVVATGVTEYTVTASDAGKYIRFTVTPKSEEGQTGSSVSAMTGGAVDVLSAFLSVSGNIKNGTMFDLKDDTNTYRGQVTITSTKTKSISTLLIAAWFDNGILSSMAVESIMLPSAAEDETGIIQQVVTTDIVKTVPKEALLQGQAIKVFLWDNNRLAPITDFVYAGDLIN